MKALWTEEEGEFHGEMVDFDPAWSHPKPVQKPHPPIVLGGETDYTLRRVVEFCDGWLLRWPARRAIRGDHRVGRRPPRQPNSLCGTGRWAAARGGEGDCHVATKGSMLGSVSHKVSSLAHCTVVVIR